MSHGVLALFILIVAAAANGCGSERDRACAALLKAELARDSTRSATASRRTFYSTKLETCIVVEESRTSVDVSIDDLSDSFLEWGKLFHCDRDGVDAAILDSVRAYRGSVFTISYDRWLDDGAGGPPRALKTPSEPFTGARCREALNRYLVRVE